MTLTMKPDELDAITLCGGFAREPRNGGSEQERRRKGGPETAHREAMASNEFAEAI